MNNTESLFQVYKAKDNAFILKDNIKSAFLHTAKCTPANMRVLEVYSRIKNRVLTYELIKDNTIRFDDTIERVYVFSCQLQQDNTRIAVYRPYNSTYDMDV